MMKRTSGTATSEATASRAEMDEESKVRLSGLTKIFDQQPAVNEVSLDVRRGDMLALLGPSGCGKTTTLRMIAGLERPTSGSIVVDGQVLADDSRMVPPELRNLGMVFQSYALWPHMTVYENVAYGLRLRRVSRKEQRERVDEALRMVGMSGSGVRPATELSGGQQQRIAIARALVTNPTLTLFDEPLSNLDAVLRESMRFELRSLRQQTQMTAIYVTHSQEEALALADKIAVMRDGVVEQVGTPVEIYDHPRTSFVAGFVGLANVLPAVVEPDGDAAIVRVAGAGWRIARDRCPNELMARGSGWVAVRPEKIGLSHVADDEKMGDKSSILRGRIGSTVFGGNVINYFLEVRGLETELRVQGPPPAVEGSGNDVNAVIDARDVILLAD